MSVQAEPYTQARLIHELRFAIDHAMTYPSDRSRFAKRIHHLITTHPKAMRTTYVRKNVGTARLAWADKEVMHATE